MPSTVPSSEQEGLARKEIEMGARQTIDDSIAGTKLELISERQMMREGHSAAVQQVERIWQGRLTGIRTHLEAVLAKSLEVSAFYMKLALTKLSNSAQADFKGSNRYPAVCITWAQQIIITRSFASMQLAEDRLKGFANRAAEVEQELQEKKDTLSRLLWWAVNTLLV